MERFTKSTLSHWFDNLQRENYLNLQDDVEDDMNFTISPGKQPEESWIDLEDRSREEQSRLLRKLGDTIEEECEEEDDEEVDQEGWLFNQSGKGSGSGSDKPNVNFKGTVNQERNDSEDKQVPYQEFQPDISTSLTTILGKPPRTSTVSPFTVYSSQYSSSQQIPRVTFMNIESSTQSLSSSSDLSASIEKRKTIDKPMGINMVNLTVILVVNAVGFFLFGFLCGVGFKRQLHINLL